MKKKTICLYCMIQNRRIKESFVFWTCHKGNTPRKSVNQLIAKTSSASETTPLGFFLYWYLFTNNFVLEKVINNYLFMIYN